MLAMVRTIIFEFFVDHDGARLGRSRHPRTVLALVGNLKQGFHGATQRRKYGEYWVHAVSNV